MDVEPLEFATLSTHLDYDNLAWPLGPLKSETPAGPALERTKEHIATSRKMAPFPIDEDIAQKGWKVQAHYFPAAMCRGLEGCTHHPDTPEPPEFHSERLSYDDGTRLIMDISRRQRERHIFRRDHKDFRPDSEQVFICVNRYYRDTEPNPKGDTFLVTHALGFCKEMHEPLVQDLIRQRGDSIHEIYAFDLDHHGSTAVLNWDVEGLAYDVADNGRDMLQFLLYYLPDGKTDPDTSSVLTPLARHENHIPERKIHAVVASYSTSVAVYVASQMPTVISDVFALDPVFPYSFDHETGEGEWHDGGMILGRLSVIRRDTFPSFEVAHKGFSASPLFQAMHPEAVKRYVYFGLFKPPGKDHVTLCMRRYLEGVLFTETNNTGANIMFSLLKNGPISAVPYERRTPLHLIMADREESMTIQSRIPQVRALLPGENINIPRYGHLLAFYGPTPAATVIDSLLSRPKL